MVENVSTDSRGARTTLGRDGRLGSLRSDRATLEIGLRVAPDEINSTVNVAAFIVLIPRSRARKKCVLPSDERAAIETDLITVDACCKSHIAGLGSIKVVRVDEVYIVHRYISATRCNRSRFSIAVAGWQWADGQATGLGDSDLIGFVGFSGRITCIPNDHHWPGTVDGGYLFIIRAGVHEDDLLCGIRWEACEGSGEASV